MEGYFGNNSNFNHAGPPLNLSNELSTLKNEGKLPWRRSELASSAVKIEEDVLVMDAIPVRSAVRTGGSRSGRVKSPLSMSSDSGALPSLSPATGYSGFRKRELCRSWEDLGTCRYGNKCVVIRLTPSAPTDPALGQHGGGKSRDMRRSDKN